MPGGKQRLKGLFTGFLQLGGTGTVLKHALAGSAILEVGSIAGGVTGGSNVCEVVTIANLTASHILVATIASGNACTTLFRAVPGVGQASFFWHLAGCAGTASQTTTRIQYIAAQV